MPVAAFTHCSHQPILDPLTSVGGSVGPGLYLSCHFCNDALDQKKQNAEGTPCPSRAGPTHWPSQNLKNQGSRDVNRCQYIKFIPNISISQVVPQTCLAIIANISNHESRGHISATRQVFKHGGPSYTDPFGNLPLKPSPKSKE